MMKSSLDGPPPTISKYQRRSAIYHSIIREARSLSCIPAARHTGDPWPHVKLPTAQDFTTPFAGAKRTGSPTETSPASHALIPEGGEGFCRRLNDDGGIVLFAAHATAYEPTYLPRVSAFARFRAFDMSSTIRDTFLITPPVLLVRQALPDAINKCVYFCPRCSVLTCTPYL